MNMIHGKKGFIYCLSHVKLGEQTHAQNTSELGFIDQHVLYGIKPFLSPSRGFPKVLKNTSFC